MGISLVGCSSAIRVSVGTLTAEGRYNTLAAVSRYDGERLRVTGVLQATGVKNVSQTQAEHYGYGIEPFATTSVEKTENVPYPYFILFDPNAPQQGVVVCYFLRQDLEDISGLRRGLLVTVEGRFQQFANEQGRFETVLNHCRLG
jgi:hypothetical protein